jgi:pyruvate dehydrogenase E2 component (dihydrolipoamide acetyltransferase)
VIALTLPQLSISMEDGKVLRWLVEDGAHVSAGQPVVEIETDKATMEVEAPADGEIRLVAEEGAVLGVASTLAQIFEGPEAAHAAPPPTEEGAIAAPPPEEAARIPPEAAPATDGEKQIASPAARRLARERGIDLGSVTGSGPDGRIVAADLEVVPAAPAPAPEVGTRKDLRTAVLANITASWQQVPHIHVGGELAADGLTAAKATATVALAEKVTMTDLLALAVARALTDIPELNGGSQRVNLALAVATEDGVVAPVLRDVTSRGLGEVVMERARLVSAARARTLDGRDLAGATCTLSNLGAFPVDFFVPVVSGPQAALVATGRVAERPVAVSGMLTVRPRIWVNVAIDHRQADGEAGGRFLAALERRITDLPTSI